MSADWDRAGLALSLLALDPEGLGGAVIRMRAGPQRDAVMRALDLPLPQKRLPISINDTDLLGGLDLGATLSAGHVIEKAGFLVGATAAVMPMAERCSRELAARLSQAIDNKRLSCLICLDEGMADDETCPAPLADRLAFCISPDGRVPDGWFAPAPLGEVVAAHMDADQMEALTRLAAQLGIDSLRAPLLAMTTAKAHARLHGRARVIAADVEAAAALVYPHRATQLPEMAEETVEDPPAPPEPQDGAQGGETEATLPDEMLVDAVRTLLPPALLAGLVPAGTAKRANGSGSGAKRKSARRGRPLPPRPGRLDGRARLDLIATLRAAVPWQTIRANALAQAKRPRGDKLLIRPSDIRVKRYQERSDRLLIFTVDASGSSAVARLGETKGAVELLLAEAYSSRDHVALVAFRGEQADLLLPPTRSLVQTKRRLAALPGGGGTPLAAGLDQAGRLAEASRGRGLTPTLVLLTDGRANISLDGAANRNQAQEDAARIASALRRAGTPSLVIDTGKRPSAALQSLSGVLGGPYIALPRADAHGLQTAVSAALSA